MSKAFAAMPTENIMRVSTRISAAIATALPKAIPTSTELTAQGAAVGFSAQVGKPQFQQFRPNGLYFVPIITIACAFFIFSESR